MNYKDFKVLDLDLIQEDQKVTLVRVSDFGFTQTIKMKIKKIFLRDYAQYRNCIQIQGRLPRKRKDSAFLIRPNQEFVMYDGYVDINTEGKVIQENENVRVVEMGMCFDENRFIAQNNNDLVKIYNTLEM